MTAALVAVCSVLLLFMTSPALAEADCNVYVGSQRMETAIFLSETAFPAGLPAGSGLVLAPADTFPEALCGSPLASAWGGPVLLTYPDGLNPQVRDEMLRLAPARVICIGLPATVVDLVQTAMGAGVTVQSIRGATIYEMSYKVAKALGAKVGDMSGATAIVTIGTKFPDAIGVSPLACHQKWPVLLTDNTTGAPLHAYAAQAIAELGIAKAIKVGTYCTLPVSVQGVANLSGADRYHTNVNVAEWGAANAGMDFEHVGVCTGDKFPDALAAGPFLGMDGGSVLLTSSTGVPSIISSAASAHSGQVDTLDFIGLPVDPTWQMCTLVPTRNPPYTPTLGVGSTGWPVKWLEQKLARLTYRPGAADGNFETYTYYGVIGFQKYQGLTLDGTMDAADWAVLETAARPVATIATTGTWIEVDKTRQVLLYIVDGVVQKTLAVSTGSSTVGVETPEGEFTILTRNLGYINGMYLLCTFTHVDPIGDLGIHGYSVVPNYPASHGCVRTNIWDQNELYPQLVLGLRLFIYKS
jgi:putative cell wall-binding protein